MFVNVCLYIVIRSMTLSTRGCIEIEMAFQTNSQVRILPSLVVQMLDIEALPWPLE